MKLQRIKNWRLLSNPNFLLTLWLGSIFIGYVIKVHHIAHNNYLIFSHSFWHALSQLPLYIPYPHEYKDLFLYGMPFTGLIAPFAVLPDYYGVLLWCLANSLLLFVAIKQMNFVKWKFAFIIWFSVNELYVSEIARQFNTGIAGLLILAFALIEKKKDFWAALMIAIGTMTKIYGIVGLAFLLFSKRKLHFIWGFLFWCGVLFFVPMLYTSPHYVITEYGQWFHILSYKNDLNMFCTYTNISLLGMVRKITHIATYSDLWIIIPGLILYAIPYFRIKQYDNKSFRLLSLSATLLFMVLFSTGTEKCGYIAAIVAVAIWYVSTPTRKKAKITNTALILFCFILTSLSSTDIFPKSIRNAYVIPYALKALPCVLIWLKIEWELITQEFSTNKLSPVPQKIETIDMILPCHNPHEGWTDVIINKYKELKVKLGIQLNLIVVNDGSSKGFDDDAIQILEKNIPDIHIINNKINQGKGAAIRSGLASSTSEFALYTDYDFPYLTESICDVVDSLKEGYDIVIARRNSSYYSQLSFRRKIMSHASRLSNFILLGLSHNDTQGGLKGFNKKGKRYLESTHISSFLFDTEFIYKASMDNTIKITETTVNLRDGVILSDMNNNVMRKELSNLLTIAWKG